MRLDPSPAFPRVFGAYTLLASFGRGGMGEVFLAQRSGLRGAERLCVVKTLRGELADDAEYTGRFLDEARVVTQLHHSGVSQVFDAGQVGTTYYLAMEFISGVTLRELEREMTKVGVRLARGVALHIVSEVLDALHYAHTLEHPLTGAQMHIVHRDVSPQNVMLSFQGDVKLIDFGLAQSALKEENTSSEVVMGKVAYMSPEQARGDAVDGRCDQFAVGVMLYELLTNQRYYGNATTREIWMRAGQGHLPGDVDALDAPLAAIIRKAVERRVDDRWASCGAMRDALDEVRTAYFPGVGRKQLKALVQEVFETRITEERKRLSRLGEISASGARAAPSVPTAKVRSSNRPDPQATISASRVMGPGAGPSSADDGAVAGAEGSSTLSRAAARAVTGPRTMQWMFGAVALFVLTVAAVVVGGRLFDLGGAPAEPPPVARLDAGGRSAPVVVEAGRAAVAAPDGPPDAAGPGPDTRSEAHKPGPRPKPKTKEKPKGKPKPRTTSAGSSSATPQGSDTPREEPARDPVKTAPRRYSLAEDVALLLRCQEKCAQRLRPLMAGKTPAELKKNEAPIRHCAKACRAP